MAIFNHVALVYGQTGQVVSFYPPMSEVLAYGHATSGATYRVFAAGQSNDDTPELGPSSATLDAVATTVSTASGYSQSNRQRLNLTATTNVAVGRRYLLANAQGQREIVVPTLVETAYVDLEEPLAFDYAITTSTFKGLRHYYTIDATFIATASKINVYGPAPLDGGASTSTAAPPYRVEWRYTLGTTDLRTITTFDVARKPAKSTVGIADLRGLVPDVVWHEWITQRGQDFAPQLEAAERDVAIDARAAGYDPNAVVDPQIWDRLVLQRWALTIGKALLFTGADIDPWLSMTAQDYTRMFEKTIGTTLRAWVDTGAAGAVTAEPARQLWLRGR